MLPNPALEARAREIGQALRCVVCQNQSIDNSAAEVARDMRRAVRERLTAGDSDGQVFDYMVQRYGDYVLLKPPFKAGTLVLWLGAPLVLLVAGGALLLAARRRRRAHLVAPPPLSDEERGVRRSAGPLMLEFLLALLTTATVGVLLVPLLRTRTARTDRLDGELAIYRDQLAELERERAAGTLSGTRPPPRASRSSAASWPPPTAQPAAPRRASAAQVPAGGARAPDPAPGAGPLSGDRPARPARGALRRRQVAARRPRAAHPRARPPPRARSPPSPTTPRRSRRWARR